MSERYYVGEVAFAAGDVLLLDSQESRHLLKVMRAQPGLRFRIFGGGNEALATLNGREGSSAVVRVEEIVPTLALPTVHIQVLLPWIKGGKTELVVQKLTELGVAAITIYSADREVAQGTADKLDRLRRVSLEACKQCERSDLPNLEYAPTLASALEASDLAMDRRILLYERERSRSFSECVNAVLNTVKEPHLLIATGPEGGFSPGELSGCATLAVFAGFGPRILRAETAPIAAVAAILALSGNA